MEKKRFYSEEFKEKAVSLSYQRDNLKELANELGVNVERIYKWRAKKRASHLGSSREDQGANGIGRSNNNDTNEEIKRLKKELKETQLELDILKKAVHIFSKSDGKSINS